MTCASAEPSCCSRRRGVSAADLPLLNSVTAEHEDLDPISLIQSFYPMVEALARARGRDPDRPPFLSKITRTQ